jgi:hypothetical protein
VNDKPLGQRGVGWHTVVCYGGPEWFHLPSALALLFPLLLVLPYPDTLRTLQVSLTHRVIRWWHILILEDLEGSTSKEPVPAYATVSRLDLRVFLARRTPVAGILISTPRMVEKLLIVGDSAVKLLVTLGARSAW